MSIYEYKDTPWDEFLQRFKGENFDSIELEQDAPVNLWVSDLGDDAEVEFTENLLPLVSDKDITATQVERGNLEDPSLTYDTCHAAVVWLSDTLRDWGVLGSSDIDAAMVDAAEEPQVMFSLVLNTDTYEGWTLGQVLEQRIEPYIHNMMCFTDRSASTAYLWDEIR